MHLPPCRLPRLIVFLSALFFTFFAFGQQAACLPTANQYCDRAFEAGLHVGGTAYGRGSSAIDVDNDGDIDIFHCDSGSKRPDHPYHSKVYINDGTGNFSYLDPVVDWGIDSSHLLSNWQALFFDSDNDGDQDLFLVNGGYNDDPESLAFYRNDLDQTGTFTDITSIAGITSDLELWWSAVAGDMDNDGLLDLLVVNRNFWQYNDTFPGQVPGDSSNALLYYRNLGNNTFEELSDSLGLPNPKGDNKNIVITDYDQDGCQDFMLCKFEHDAGRFNSLDYGARLFRNTGCGTSFTEIPLGLTDQILPGEGSPEYLVFAAASLDYNQDGFPDFYLGRWHWQDYILLNDGNGGFTKLGAGIGLDANIGVGQPYENTMGLTIADIFHNDGYPDLILGPGNPGVPGEPVVYCHNGSSLDFSRCSDDFELAQGPSRHHGVSVADYDDDGDVDIFWNLGGFAGYGDGELDTAGVPQWIPTDELPTFFENQSTTGSPFPTASVQLVGDVSNRDAIGAKIEMEFVDSSGGTEYRYYYKESANGFMSQNSPCITMAMGMIPSGQATLTVYWPSGIISPGIIVTAGSKIIINENPTGIEEEPFADSFRIAPNPFEDKITVFTQSKVHSIQLLNIQGQVILQGELRSISNEKIDLDLQDINAGIYFVKIKGIEKTEIKRIVKIK